MLYSRQKPITDTISSLSRRDIAGSVVFGLLFGAAVVAAVVSWRVDAAEKQELEAKIDAFAMDAFERAEQSRNRTCPRPVLRGKPLTGSAQQKMLAVVEGIIDDDACHEAISALHSRKPDLLEKLYVAPEPLPNGLVPSSKKSFSRRGPVKPFDDPIWDTADLNRVDQACNPLIAQMRAATIHQEACTPYRSGIRCLDMGMRVIRLARAVQISAARSFTRGETREGTIVLLDGLRFFQDLTRGGTTLMDLSLSSTARLLLLSVLERAIRDPVSRDMALLAEVEQELGTLIETEPTPTSVLRGEYLTMALENELPPIVGKDVLVPPGGVCIRQRSEGMPPDVPLPGQRAGPITSAQSEWWLHLEVWNDVMQRAIRACEKQDLPGECQLAAAEVFKGHVDQAIYEELHEYWESQGIERDPEELREEASSRLDRYLAHNGIVLFRLAALRLASAAYRFAAHGGCPELADFDSTPLSKMRNDPYSGQPIRIDAVDERQLLFTSPARTYDEWEKKPRHPIDRPVMVFTCPAPPSGSIDSLAIRELEISLLEKQPLHLVETETPDTGEKQTGLSGVLEVTIANNSTQALSLAHMFPANLLFVDRKRVREIVPIHDCMPGFLLVDPVVPPEQGNLTDFVITLARGQRRTLVLDDWGCDGGPFSPSMRPGTYDIYYRIHAWDPEKAYLPADKVGLLPADARSKNKLNGMKEVLHSQWFWEDAWSSPPLRVELRMSGLN